MNSPTDPPTEEDRISKIEARLNAIDAETLKALGSNSVIEALVKRAGDNLLESQLLRYLHFVLIGFAVAGLVVWAGGTVYSGIQIASIQERAAQTEQKIDAAAAEVSSRSDKVLEKSVEFEKTINTQVDEITKDLKDRIEKAAAAVEAEVEPAQLRIERAFKAVDEITNNSKVRMEKAAEAVEAEVEPAKRSIEIASQAVEQARGPAEERISRAASATENTVDPAKARIEAAAKQVETSSAAATDEIASQQAVALAKLEVPSIDELGKVKAQIDGLERAGGRLNLTSIRSFIDLQVAAVLVFSVLVFAISIAAWVRAGRKGGG